MKPSARSKEILSLLQEKQELTVEDVCTIFGVSPATARRDISTIVEEYKAEKTWGGLRVFGTHSHPMPPSGQRAALFPEEKKRIAQKAASLCYDGDIIFIDGGTTTLHLAQSLASRPVRVITNSILVAHEIDRLRQGQGGAEVFLSGGYLYPFSGLLVGPEAVESLSRHYAHVAFLSVGGITEGGINNNHHLVVEVEKAMLSQAKRIILLADHSKFGHREMVPECTWNEFHYLVTDRPPEEPYVRLAGSRLVVA